MAKIMISLQTWQVVLRKKKRENQALLDVKPKPKLKPSKKPKKTKTEMQLANVSNQLNLKKINACFKPL